jgi:hypothetical protein
MEERRLVVDEPDATTIAHLEGDDVLTDRELLEYIAGMLRRLEPLVETLEGFAPAFAAAGGSNGKKPSALKMAMAAARLGASE